MPTTKNLTYKNIDYPSGQPFVRYIKNAQIIYLHHSNQIITKEMHRKKFTGQFFVTDMEGNETAGKTFPNPRMKKRMDMVHFTNDPDDENMCAVIECVFLPDGLTELAFRDKKHKELIAVATYNPVNNALSQHTEYYRSGRIAQTVSMDDYGLTTELKGFRNDEKNSLEDLYIFENGIPKLCIDYDQNMQKIAETLMEDMSVGTNNYIEYKDGVQTNWRTENFKTVKMIATENDLVVEEIDYNADEQQLTRSFYEHDHAGNLLTKSIYLAKTWNDEGRMTSGLIKGYEDLNCKKFWHPKTMGNFIDNQEGMLVTHGLVVMYTSPNTAFLVWFENGNEIGEWVKGRPLIDKDGILSAYSDIEKDKPKNYKPT